MKVHNLAFLVRYTTTLIHEESEPHTTMLLWSLLVHWSWYWSMQIKLVTKAIKGFFPPRYWNLSNMLVLHFVPWTVTILDMCMHIVIYWVVSSLTERNLSAGPHMVFFLLNLIAFLGVLLMFKPFMGEKKKKEPSEQLQLQDIQQ